MGKTLGSGQVSTGNAACLSARPRDRDRRGERAWSSELDHYIRKQHMWENTLALPADYRHVRGCPDRKGTGRGGGGRGDLEVGSPH